MLRRASFFLSRTWTNPPGRFPASFPLVVVTLPAVPDLSSNSRGVRIAIDRLPFHADGLADATLAPERSARLRRLSLDLASCRPGPSPCRRRCSSCSGQLVFPQASPLDLRAEIFLLEKNSKELAA